jgi:hypothetical protein
MLYILNLGSNHIIAIIFPFIKTNSVLLHGIVGNNEKAHATVIFEVMLKFKRSE